MSSRRSISPIDPSLSTLNAADLLRHFILLETQYKDDLELLIKVFRNPMRKFSSVSELVDRVFGPLDEIFELTSRFLSDFADAKDMRDDLHQQISLVEPFQNFLEVEETTFFSLSSLDAMFAGQRIRVLRELRRNARRSAARGELSTVVQRRAAGRIFSGE